MRPIFHAIFWSSLAACAASAVELPADTEFKVRLDRSISSEWAHSGETWSGTLASDVMVDGTRVARRSDAVEGRVQESGPSGLDLEVTAIETVEGRVELSADTSRQESRRGLGHILKVAGGGAAAGAIIGAIAGGGRAAVAGAGAGAAAGSAAAALTGKKKAELPAEAVLTFWTR